MATLDDIQIGHQITFMAADGRSCTLSAEEDGEAPTNIRVNMPNGFRNRAVAKKADAIVIRNGNTFEVLQYTQYGLMDALGNLDEGETQIHSTGSAPYRISIRDTDIRLGNVATFTRSGNATALFGPLSVIGNTSLSGELTGAKSAVFTRDISYSHDMPNGDTPTVASWYVVGNPAPPTVQGHDAAFIVTFANPAKEITKAITMFTIAFKRTYPRTPAVIVACTGGSQQGGSVIWNASATNVAVIWNDSTDINQGSTSEFTVIVRGI